MSMTVCSSLQEIPPGYFLAECAVSGGNLQDYLRAIAEAAGGRLCVRLQPVYMDFPLPCPSGSGTPLTPQQLRERHRNAPCFFSEALCTEYFTYVEEGRLHAVLYDSPDSLKKKYQCLQACGIPMVLIEDPQLRSLLTR